MILEAILGKIKLYEKGQDKKWTELIQVRVVFEDFSGTQNTFSPFPEYWQPVLRRRWRWIWFRLVAYWRLNNWILYFTSQKPKFLFFEFTNTTPEKNWKSFRVDQHNVYYSFVFLADSVLICLQAKSGWTTKIHRLCVWRQFRWDKDQSLKNLYNKNCPRAQRPDFAAWMSRSLVRLSTIVPSRSSCMVSAITRYFPHVADYVIGILLRCH